MLREISIERINSFQSNNTQFLNITEKLYSNFSYAIKSRGNRDYIDLDKIKDEKDYAYAERFTKDPLKQNKGQGKQEKLLNKFSQNKRMDIVKHKEICLINGEIKNKKGQLSSAPDIDFVVSDDKYKIMTTCKKTNGEGGYQNDQYRAIEQFILNCPNQDALSNICGLILVDGSFWNENRIKELNKLISIKNKRCDILTNDQFKQYIK